MKTAMPIASRKPFRKTAPSTPSSRRVRPTPWPCRKPGTSRFSTMCTAASAAERVIVTIQAVATNPSRQSTNSLPFRTSRFSSIAIEPCPWGLCLETTRYIGNIPKRVKSTMRRVAMGESPGRDRRDGRYVAQGGEVIDASQAHHLPPRVLLLALPGLGPCTSSMRFSKPEL